MVETTGPAPATRANRVWAITAVSALGGLLFGYDTGVVSGGLLFVTKQFHLGPLGEGMVVSALLVGAALSAATAGRLADRHGRRPLLIEAAVVFAIGAILAGLAPTTAVLVGARFVLGLGVGAASAVVPLYIAEMAPAHRRGALVTVNQLMITVGIMVSYLIGFAFAPIEGWRWMFALALVPAVLLGVGMLFLPDTPRFLVSRNRVADARRVLERVRGGDVAAELDTIAAVQRRESDETRGIRELGKKWIRPALIAGVGLSVFSQIAGVNTIIYFAPSVLVASGFGASASILAQVGIGAVNVLMTVVAILVMDKIGRRTLALTAFGGMAVSMLALGVVYVVPNAPAPLTIACMAVYIIFFAFGLGTSVWVVMSEIFPLSVRGAAVGLATTAQWAANFVVSLVFPSLIAGLGSAPTFWLFGVVCVLAVWFVHRRIPETRGRTLEQIEEDFRRTGGAETAAR